MQTYELARVPRAISVPRHLSPLGQMMAILEQVGNSDELSVIGQVRTCFGLVHWNQTSIRHLLADATPLVLDAIAKRFDQRMQTPTEAITLARAVDARLNFGLLLLHGSPEEAAKAFETQVLMVLNRAVLLGYRPGMTLTDLAWQALSRNATGVAVGEIGKQSVSNQPENLASFWRRPAYLFLAACMKRGREKTETLRAQMNRLEQQNGGVVRDAKVLPARQSIQNGVSWLEGDPDAHFTCEHAMELEDKLTSYEAALTVGRSVLRAELPLRGADLYVGEEGLFIGWVYTAILKAGLGTVASRDVLSPEQAVEAQQKLRETNTETICDEILSVVRSRCQRIESSVLLEAEKYIRSLAEEHIRDLCRSAHAPMLSTHFIDPYLSSGFAKDFTHESALEYLHAQTNDLGEEVGLNLELLPAIENGIEWKRFDSEEIQMMLDLHEIPDDMLLRHLSELQKPARTFVVEWFLRNVPNLVNDFLDSGRLSWKRSVGEQYFKVLRQPYLERAVRDLLKSESKIDDRLAELVEMMTRLPDEALCDLWNDKSLYASLSIVVYLFLFESRGLEVEPKHAQQLKDQLGNVFDRYAMESYVKVRAELYADRDEEDDVLLPPWEETATSRTSWECVRKLKIAFGSRLSDLISRQTELECYRQSVAHERKKDALTAKFLADRTVYYTPK